MDMSGNPPQEPTPQQSSYIPPPPPPPQPAKKGFNWLACCGITCLVLVIIGALMAWGCYRMAKPFIAMIAEMKVIQEEVMRTDSATVRSAATAVDGSTLTQTPSDYKDKWLAVEDTIVSTTMGANPFSGGNAQAQNATQYTLTSGIMVIDLSNAPPVGSGGDTIRAYGKAYIMDWKDLEKAPIFGKLVEELKKESAPGANTLQLPIVIAKEVELVTAGGGGEEEQPQDDAPAEESSGWVQ